MSVRERSRFAGLTLAALVALVALGAVVLVAPTAPAQAAADYEIEWLSPDVVPSAVDRVRADASMRVVTHDFDFWDSAPTAEFVLRNAAGTVVNRQTALPECPEHVSSCFPDPGWGTEYAWTWDGRRADGTLRPAGGYALSAEVPDGEGGTTTLDLGDAWIRHLETVEGVRTWFPAPHASYRIVGRCSSVTAPGPHLWTHSVGLLSLSRCRSTIGANDRAAQTFRLPIDARFIDRIVGWRVDVYGAPVRPGMRATVWGMDSSRKWHRAAVLGNGLGWHYGTPRSASFASWDSTRSQPTLTGFVQARVDNGNRYDIKRLRTVLSYRAWVR